MASDEGTRKSSGGGTTPIPSQSPARDLSGRVLGDFQVERLLGQGGMGAVYLARQVSLDRPVALKVLRPDCAGDPAYMARFEAEAWAAAKLNHPNIVHIYTLGGFGDVRFIAMEYVQGTNLRDYLRKKGVPELPLALAIMRQSGLAVGAAAEAGLIHRDIKPENLLLTRKGQVKVADFGLARLPDENALHVTGEGMTVGTPMYMSPEQVRGQDVDHRSDLYSLGVTFFCLLAGEPPFRADTAVALALKHLNEEPPDLADLRPDLPPELTSLVMKLMAKSPEDRYQTASEMLRDLARAKEKVQAALAEASTVTAPAVVRPGSGAARSSASGPIDWQPRRSWVVSGILAGLVLGAGLGWIARSEELLSASAPSPTVPALWLADWRVVPKQPTAEAQYRFAQLRAEPYEREAAWLAVPGRFPNDSGRSLSAYVQLARLYMRRGEADRIGALSRSIAEDKTSPDAPRERWQTLARVAHAGQFALGGDSREVAASFGNSMNAAAMDPAVAELALEVLARLARSGGALPASLVTFRTQLLGPLRLVPSLLDPASNASPGP